MTDFENNFTRMEDVIFHALAGKYRNGDANLRAGRIRPLLDYFGKLPLDEVPEVGNIIGGVDQDILNQVATLVRLERDWAKRPEAELDLITMHRALCGSGNGSPG